MANIEKKSVTFYVTRTDGEIPAAGPSIIWPFGNGLTQGMTIRDTNQHPADAAKNVYFENGSFTTSDPDVIWLLDHYNSGGTYEDAKRGISINFPGVRFLCNISRTDPAASKVKVVTTEVEKVVEVTKYPRIVLESMDPAQLMAIIGSLGVDASNADQTTMSLVQLLDDKGFVKN